MTRTKLILPFLLLLAAASATAHEDHARAADGQARAMTPPQPIAARYELRAGARSIDWFLTRDAARIETYNAGSRQAEVWERTRTGEIEYRRIFLDDRRIVEYTAGELKARRAAPDWSALASVIAPARIAGLRKTGERTVLGRRALVLEGRIEGVPTRLWWLPEAQLPARLERGRGKGLVRFSLRELHAGAPAGWPRMDEARLSGFGLIDAADFGDMQYDPFVQKVMQQDGDAHGHNHAH